jgi:hypothetical protein
MIDGCFKDLSGTGTARPIIQVSPTDHHYIEVLQRVDENDSKRQAKSICKQLIASTVSLVH